MEQVDTTMNKKRSIFFDTGYFIKEGLHAIMAHGFMSFAAVCMIIACLLIMGSFSLVAVNMDQMLGNLEAENEFLAYIDDTFSTEDAAKFHTTIVSIPNVSAADFVSREQALDDYKATQESNVLLDDLPADVLRDRYRIRVFDIQQMADTVAAVQDLDCVAHVSVALDIANGFVMIRNISNFVATVLIVVLVLISLFIMSNTIKLATFYRREEISIMKMCGATNGFIRAPFVIEGMILGSLGALLAFFFQWFIYHLLVGFMEDSGGVALLTLLPFESMANEIFRIFMAAGFSIGVGGSLLAIRKFLQV